MACKIEFAKNGKPNNVLNQTGQPSTLFKQILNIPTISFKQAVELYKNIYSDKLQGKVRFQISGERGIQNLEPQERQRRLQNLAVAKEMFSKGENPLKIKQLTGWEQNPIDKMWRFEVPNGQLIRTEFEIGKEYNIGEVLNSELSEMYPDLKIIFENVGNKRLKGGYDRDSKKIIFNALSGEYINVGGGNTIKPKYPVELRRELSHEFTHHIQSIEGFGRGGNSELVIQRAVELVGLPKPTIQEVELKLEDSTLLNSDKNLLNAYLKYLKADNFLDKEEILYKAYQSISGEVEARAVESRDALMFENYQDSLMSRDFTVAPEDQILLGVSPAKFQIIGERGARNLDQIEEATFRMDNLLVAKEMEQAGKTPKEIRLATGWEKVNNEWKYEVGDVKLKINSVELGKEYSFSEIAESKEIEKAYPKIKDLKVIFNNNGRNSYRRDTGVIELDAEGSLTQADGWQYTSKIDGRGNMYRLQPLVERNLNHEAIHFIQQEEGFYRGGSPNIIIEKAKELSGIVDQDNSVTQIEKLQQALNNTDNQSDKNILTSAINYLSGDDNAFTVAYSNIAGEVEARNVERRMIMSPEQRRQTLLSETEDVSQEDKIFLRENIGTSMSLNSPQKAEKEIIDRLKQTGLANTVTELNSQEIEEKLKELGVDEQTRKQVSNYLKSGYFSNAEFALSSLKDKNSKNAVGWIKQLTDVTKNGGIKNVNQELEWIGLEDYLNNYVKENNPKAGNISFDVVNDFIQSNQIEIVDVTKGLKVSELDLIKAGFTVEEDAVGNSIVFLNGIEVKGENDKRLNSFQKDLLGNYYQLDDTATKYSQYQLKGGENYREVLLTLPPKKYTKTTKISDFYSQGFIDEQYSLVEKLKNAGYTINKEGAIFDLEGNFVPYGEGKIPSEVENDIIDNISLEIIFFTPQKVYTEEISYGSSHWDERNILAHVRMNEKTLPDGRKVLIVNEIQADISQDLKKEQDKILLRVEKEFDNFLDNLIRNNVIIEEC